MVNEFGIVGCRGGYVDLWGEKVLEDFRFGRIELISIFFRRVFGFYLEWGG